MPPAMPADYGICRGRTIETLHQGNPWPRRLFGLKTLISETRGLTLFTPAVIHPLATLEGGLSQVEEQVFQELARGAGASRVLVWVGAPLSDAEVLAKLRGD